MTPADAAILLGVAPDSPPELLDSRFRELRSLHESKIASALTPGLRDKYSASLADITAAYEVLVVARDSAAMPALSRPPDSAASPSATRLPPLPPAAPTVPLSRSVAPPAARRKSALRFVVPAVAVIAMVALGVRWWQRSQAETQARLQREALAQKEAADARQIAETAEKQRIAAAEKAERQKREQALAVVRSRFNEANASLDSAARAQQAAERELAEWKARRDELMASGKTSTTPDARALAARIEAHESYVGRLADALAGHRTKTARQQAGDALAVRPPEQAAPIVESYAKVVRELQLEIAAAREQFLVITGRLRATSEPAGISFKLTDAYGRESEGTTPAELPEVPLGPATLTFRRAHWPDSVQTVTIAKGQTAAASANFTGASVQLTSTPAGLDFVFSGQGITERGQTPASLPDLPPGAYSFTVTRPGWPEQKKSLVLALGEAANASAEYPAGGTLSIYSTPAGAEVWLRDEKLGLTPLTQSDLPPGSYEMELRLKNYFPAKVSGQLPAGGKLESAATLAVNERQAIADLIASHAGTWRMAAPGMALSKLRFTSGSTVVESRTLVGGLWTSTIDTNYDVLAMDVPSGTLTLGYKKYRLMVTFVGDRLQMTAPGFPGSQEYRRTVPTDW